MTIMLLRTLIGSAAHLLERMDGAPLPLPHSFVNCLVVCQNVIENFGSTQRKTHAGRNHDVLYSPRHSGKRHD